MSCNHVKLKKALRCCFIALLLLAQQQQSLATGQPVIGVLDGNRSQLQKDSAVIVTDNNYFDTAFLKKVDTPYAVKNIITLRINESATIDLRDSFTLTVMGMVYERNSLTAAYDAVDRPFAV